MQKRHKHTLSYRADRGLRAVALVGVSLLALALASPAAAASKAAQPLLQADRLSFDENTNIITATGNVEVSQNDQVLRADKITYDRNTNVVRAQGNIAVKNLKSGEILHAKQLEMTSDMKEGFISGIGILFPDNSRLAAADAERYEGRYLVVNRGVYSACNLCKDDPNKPPLWQIKGKRVTHDAEKKDVIYRDATVEFGGVPLFYTPYLAHPDPSVKRRQGVLAPVAGYSQNLGSMLRVPYYFDLAPHSDLVFAPTFSTEDKLQLAADWRHRFSGGSMSWSGSVARTDFVNEDGIDRGYQWRGHLFGQSRFNLNRLWRAGTDVNFASDKSYLPRYKISSEDTLVNRAYAERFSGRSYAVGNMYYFQDLRPGTRLTEPFVAPELRYSALGEPGRTLGGRWSLSTGMLVTSRERDIPLTQQGPSTRRFSVDAGWERQLVSTTGFLTTVSAFARADAYWADNVPDPDKPLGSGFTNIERVRPFAQTDIAVRYPLGRRGDGYQQIVEPITVLSVAPRVSRKTILPNEDSLDVAFDETSLFSPNRFTGVDRIEGGTRTAYGIRHSLVGDNGAKIEMIGGQVFRLKKDLSLPDSSGLQERFSDYVGRIDVQPAKWLEANYSFRLDPKDLEFTWQQFTAAAGVPAFKPRVNYLSVEQGGVSLSDNQRIEEGTLGFSSRFTDYWTFSAYHKHAFKPAPGPRTTELTLGYKDECFEAALTGQRDHTSRLDVKDGTTVLFRIFLKNIGGIETDSLSPGGS